VVVRGLASGASRCRPLSLLLAEKRVAALDDVIQALPADAPVYVTRQAVLDRIAGFELHRGILALGEKPAPPPLQDLLSDVAADDVFVVASGIGNHDNMGGLFRNAAAFGARAVLLDSTCCDPFYRKAIRVSVGGGLLVPFVQLAPGVDMVELFAAQGFETLSLSPSGQVELADCLRPKRCAVLFGAEGPGLSASVLARTKTVRLTMVGGFDSLNVATTSGIVLHHLTRKA
jgi:tRNA G18 (ribose-2'-O)-methylase SpoU